MVEGGVSNGIPGQGIEVHRLRGRLRLYGRGTAVLSRQAVQKRAQAVQSLQDKTCLRAGGNASCTRTRFRQGGNTNRLLAMWEGNYGPFQTDPGPSRLLSRMLPTAAAGGFSLNLYKAG
jgi:hypothetical protein